MTEFVFESGLPSVIGCARSRMVFAFCCSYRRLEKLGMCSRYVQLVYLECEWSLNAFGFYASSFPLVLRDQISLPAGQTQKLLPPRRILLPPPRRSSPSSKEPTDRWRVGSGRRPSNQEGKGTSTFPQRWCLTPDIHPDRKSCGTCLLTAW